MDDDGWIRVGSVDVATLPRRQADGRAVRQLLEEHGYVGVQDRDIRCELHCMRDDALTSTLVVYVAATPSPRRVRRKHRHG